MIIDFSGRKSVDADNVKVEAIDEQQPSVETPQQQQSGKKSSKKSVPWKVKEEEVEQGTIWNNEEIFFIFVAYSGFIFWLVAII